jgi:hypothetical protein
MSVLRWLLGERAPLIRVHVLVRGRIGSGWYDIDRGFDLPAGTALAELVARGSRPGLLLEVALRDSPHVRDTLMVNGERCPLAGTRRRHPRRRRPALPPLPLAGG